MQCSAYCAPVPVRKCPCLSRCICACRSVRVCVQERKRELQLLKVEPSSQLLIQGGDACCFPLTNALFTGVSVHRCSSATSPQTNRSLHMLLFPARKYKAYQLPLWQPNSDMDVSLTIPACRQAKEQLTRDLMVCGLKRSRLLWGKGVWLSIDLRKPWSLIKTPWYMFIMWGRIITPVLDKTRQWGRSNTPGLSKTHRGIFLHKAAVHG